ncbi:hypothetical protein [Gloeocapsa sp. PCC 73106]|uniref:hypothetical protein n=1 Tax=Gloeocapsa sp. PCC 73106 TaxID=102232 RepID=UPI0002AC5295|nr:hypothetical protein [Gloeocapsa sp. PCC 73106]ELS00116.1 hypothetical protein GLO73106DRAFT_00039710 [Gloeocapsa sp. PCC 73106]
MTITSPGISHNISNFTQTMKSLLELLELKEEDEYGTLKPTEYAFKTIIHLLLEAYEHLGEKFPKGTASTDDEGGIRLNWKNRTKDSRVCLFCPANSQETAYIYHQTNDEYASDEEVSGTVLVYWLDQFEEA